VLFTPSSAAAGAVALPDTAMTIADAARYLAVHEPDLGITDPYELTPPQLDAATALLEHQAPHVALWWSAFTDLVDAFEAGTVDVAEGSPLAFSVLSLGRRDAYTASIPSEGATGWADTWMMTADAPHPNCMIRWMRWTSTADVQAEMAIWYGGSPSNAEACDAIRSKLGDTASAGDTLRLEHCGDAAFLSSLALWRTPSVSCGDDRGRVCAGYPAWLERWSSIRDGV
jgi:putative spermidine/putrescine transport system substrate-binding protein